MSEEKKYGSVLYKAVEIMDFLRDIEAPVSLMEICKAFTLNKGTASKIMNSMLDLNLVIRHEQTNRFTLGSRLIGYGAAAARQFNIETLATPVMEELHSKIGETIHLGIEQNRRMMYLKKYEAFSTVNLRSRVGQDVPMYASAMGKAVLAVKSDRVIKDYYHSVDIIQYTENTITNFDEFMKEIQIIRKDGYAIDREEYELGVQSAAITFTKFGEVYGAMSISIPKYRMTKELKQEIYSSLLVAKEKVEEKL
ncbi:IclR family transcriptional regulator [Peribacillus sp. NPDC097675]|uniref:IclR family transcriptional regulator n=1 Tax=Peribacillus sp. NPDC097675 TaxID=3390618 RepID=UPI003D058A38